MIIALSLLGLSLASGGLIIFELRNAPEGYDDRDGFHFVRKPGAPPNVSANKKTGGVLAGKHCARRHRGVGSLRSALPNN